MRMFLSHTWQPDCLGRDTHSRVKDIARELREQKGIHPWLDEEQMTHDVDSCMASGIDASQVVIIFLTKSYCEKVQKAASNPQYRDNCYKEFSYAVVSHKVMIPVVFEPFMKDVSNWPCGVVKMNLASQFYVDGSDATPDTIAARIIQNTVRALRKTTKTRHRKAPIINHRPYNLKMSTILRSKWMWRPSRVQPAIVRC